MAVAKADWLELPQVVWKADSLVVETVGQRVGLLVVDWVGTWVFWMAVLWAHLPADEKVDSSAVLKVGLWVYQQAEHLVDP